MSGGDRHQLGAQTTTQPQRPRSSSSLRRANSDLKHVSGRNDGPSSPPHSSSANAPTRGVRRVHSGPQQSLRAKQRPSLTSPRQRPFRRSCTALSVSPTGRKSYVRQHASFQEETMASSSSNNPQRRTSATKQNTLLNSSSHHGAAIRKNNQSAVVNAEILGPSTLRSIEDHRQGIAELRPARRKIRWNAAMEKHQSGPRNSFRIQDFGLHDLELKGAAAAATTGTTVSSLSSGGGGGDSLASSGHSFQQQQSQQQQQVVTPEQLAAAQEEERKKKQAAAIDDVERKIRKAFKAIRRVTRDVKKEKDIQQDMQRQNQQLRKELVAMPVPSTGSMRTSVKQMTMTRGLLQESVTELDEQLTFLEVQKQRIEQQHADLLSHLLLGDSGGGGGGGGMQDPPREDYRFPMNIAMKRKPRSASQKLRPSAAGLGTESLVLSGAEEASDIDSHLSSDFGSLSRTSSAEWSSGDYEEMILAAKEQAAAARKAAAGPPLKRMPPRCSATPAAA